MAEPIRFVTGHAGADGEKAVGAAHAKRRFPISAPSSLTTSKKGDRTAQVARMYPVRWTVSVEPSEYVIFTSGEKVPAAG